MVTVAFMSTIILLAERIILIHFPKDIMRFQFCILNLETMEVSES